MIFQHACWLKNHTTTCALPSTTPYEAATGSKPDLSAVHEWGTIIWVHRHVKGTGWVLTVILKVHGPIGQTAAPLPSNIACTSDLCRRPCTSGGVKPDEPNKSVEPDFDEGEPQTTTPPAPPVPSAARVAHSKSLSLGVRNRPCKGQ